MLEKAAGTVLTDEEYFTLEHQSLKRPTGRDLEDIERVLTQGEFSMQEEWWEAYAEPIPTWTEYDPHVWSRIKGMIRRRPPSPQILEPLNLGRISGLIMGEVWTGYARTYRPVLRRWGRIHPRMYLEMSDKEPVQFYGKMINALARKHLWYYTSRPKGLRAIILARITQPTLLGKAKEKTQYIITHGYLVKPQIAEQFTRLYKSRKGRRTIAGSQIIEEYWLSPAEETTLKRLP